jgi:hypothetical protein
MWERAPLGGGLATTVARPSDWSAPVGDAPEGVRVRHGLVTPADVVDVFVYVVVLNLATQYVPQVITETFTISLLTAVMLKLVLEVVVVFKNRAKGRFTAATTPRGKVVGASLLWLVLFGSKFVVLKIEDPIFGDSVNLGGFCSVTGLILVLMIARAGVRRLLAQGSKQLILRFRSSRIA